MSQVNNIKQMTYSTTGIRTRAEIAVDNLQTAGIMAEIALICARTGHIDLAKWFKEDAAKWRSYPQVS